MVSRSQVQLGNEGNLGRGETATEAVALLTNTDGHRPPLEQRTKSRHS